MQAVLEVSPIAFLGNFDLFESVFGLVAFLTPLGWQSNDRDFPLQLCLTELLLENWQTLKHNVNFLQVGCLLLRALESKINPCTRYPGFEKLFRAIASKFLTSSLSAQNCENCEFHVAEARCESKHINNVSHLHTMIFRFHLFEAIFRWEKKQRNNS